MWGVWGGRKSFQCILLIIILIFESCKYFTYSKIKQRAKRKKMVILICFVFNFWLTNTSFQVDCINIVILLGDVFEIIHIF